MPQTLSSHPHILASSHTPAARHYNSALSIWLSVDPMADKYPSTSPYAYCANNPVKLVDPDGREWLNEEDEKFAQLLIACAQKQQLKYKKDTKEYALLQEGIDGLTFMGETTLKKFTFTESGNIENNDISCGYVSKDNDLVFHINYLVSDKRPEVKNGSAWHESIHLTRFLKHFPFYSDWEKTKTGQSSQYSDFGYTFNGGPILQSESLEAKRDEENHAYYSQYVFSPKSMPYDGILPLTKEGIDNYVENTLKKTIKR